MQHRSHGAKGTQCEVPANTPFEADELVKGLKIENRNIICHKRLQATVVNHYHGNGWGMLKSITFIFSLQLVSNIFRWLCVAHKMFSYPLKKTPNPKGT